MDSGVGTVKINERDPSIEGRMLLAVSESVARRKSFLSLRATALSRIQISGAAPLRATTGNSSYVQRFHSKLAASFLLRYTWIAFVYFYCTNSR